jgi:hypothetical protein
VEWCLSLRWIIALVARSGIFAAVAAEEEEAEEE